MIVFDVDGTLIGGEIHDWKCFDEAFAEAAGFGLNAAFFHGLEEVTAKAIVHQALENRDGVDKHDVETRTRKGYAQRLREVHQRDENAFSAIEGVASILEEIRERGIPLAIVMRASASTKARATPSGRLASSIKIGNASTPT